MKKNKKEIKGIFLTSGEVLPEFWNVVSFSLKEFFSQI